jgi:hypothetical protein
MNSTTGKRSPLIEALYFKSVTPEEREKIEIDDRLENFAEQFEYKNKNDYYSTQQSRDQFKIRI